MSKLHSGISKKEAKIGWFFLVWLLWAIGPGLILSDKPIWIGPFPLLYWHAIIAWITSIVFAYLLGYKCKFANMDALELTLEQENNEKEVLGRVN